MDREGNAAIGSDPQLSSRRSLLTSIFQRCRDDPKGAVHRSWAMSLVFMTLIVIVGIFVAIGMGKNGGPKSLQFAAIWTALIQFFMAIVGTFILRRFPTHFSIGFLLGLVIVVAQQNIITFATLNDYYYYSTSRTLANLSLIMFFCNIVFAVMLYYFRAHILIQVDDKNTRMGEQAPGGDYENYDDVEESDVN